VRVADGNDKLSLDPLRSVEINCTCTGNSFEGTGFVYWPSRDRVSISPRSCVDFAEILCRFRPDHSRRDCVSILPDDILEFGLDLKNLHRPIVQGLRNEIVYLYVCSSHDVLDFLQDV